MDVVIIFNGLGNQMSQYAFYLRKKEIDKNTFLLNYCSIDSHNGSELESVFNIDTRNGLLQRFLYLPFRLLLSEKISSVKLLRLILKGLKINIVKENYDYDFHPENLIPSKQTTFYYGGWSTEKYFLPVKDKILNAFKFTPPTDADNVSHINNIANTNSVSIHVRRGDYLAADNINIFGGVCTKAYYLKAIEEIKTRVTSPHFFVFSNDFEWVKENLPLDNVTYVTCNSGTSSWKDMYLMSLCKHNVVANSTFSWWGAWLNKNQNKIVVSPARYLNNDIKTDFYPETWIKVSA